MSWQVDSYRFVRGLNGRLVRSWIEMESPREIPWIPLPKPLTDCTVSLISTAGIALTTDTPFDQDGERRNPWWGDASFRILPRATTEAAIEVYHLHIDPTNARKDLNSLLPLQRLNELEHAGEIGRSAPSHYSIMGYILQPEVLLRETTQAIIQHLGEEHVDVVVLIPV